MPTLDFKGKQFVYAHHLTVLFRQLNVDVKKSLPTDGKASLEDNLIIHGDNLHALKALLPKYAGKVKCIYIDPPYNTGNKGWCFNDNVNAPLIREWWKESANPIDKEDLERHVLLGSPAHFWNGANLVIRKLAAEPEGYALVKQNPHAPTPIPWPVPVRQPRARGSP